MSEPIHPSVPLTDLPDVSRRNLFRIAGATVLSTELLEAQAAAKDPHAGMKMPAAAGSNMAPLPNGQSAPKTLSGGPNYVPKHLNPHAFRTLRQVGDLIMPADATSPAASEAGAAEFIDFLCSRNEDLANIFDGGLAWLDEYMKHKYTTDFLSSTPAQQTALMDAAYGQRGGTPEVAAGATFFLWARNMVIDAYYTSPAGVRDLGYMGNTARASFSVPQEAADYALKRSPFGS